MHFEGRNRIVVLLENCATFHFNDQFPKVRGREKGRDYWFSQRQLLFSNKEKKKTRKPLQIIHFASE